MIAAAHWQELTTPWPWTFFTPSEMACKGDGSIELDEQFMDRLQLLRTTMGQPLKVSSGYRSPAYNVSVSDTGETGPHTTGRAVDLIVSGTTAFDVIRNALQLGFTGIGVSQRGDHATRFIHLDDLVVGRPMVWSY